MSLDPRDGLTGTASPTISDLNYTISGSNATVTGATSTNIITLTIPSTITVNNIVYNVTSIGDSAFYGYSILTSVIIPNSVLTIGPAAFRYCTILESATIGSSVTSIGSQAFQDCRLSTLIIPNSVLTIGPAAFSYCNGLTSATIGSGVTSIDNSAFSECSSLAKVYFMGNIPTIGSNNFTANANDTAYYYPGAQNVSSLSPTPPIFTYTSEMTPPTLSVAKSQNASRADYMIYNYSLQHLILSGLFSLSDLVGIGYELPELKQNFSREELILSQLFDGSELKREGLIEPGFGITFFIIVIVLNGEFSIRKSYSLNNTSEHIVRYHVFFEGQYFQTELSRKYM
jgi:hypothetical protein